MLVSTIKLTESKLSAEDRADLRVHEAERGDRGRAECSGNRRGGEELRTIGVTQVVGGGDVERPRNVEF